VLEPQQKQLYLDMLQCVAQFGVDNDLELFTAVGFGFDLSFGENQIRNIITVEDYLSIMGDKVKETLGKNDSLTVEIFARNRPGFFLLTPDKKVYFLKEDVNENFEHFDPKKDEFVASAELPIGGKDKLVIPNKTTFPKPETYFATATRDKAVDGKFYHEKQQAGKCVIHAAHAFLGFAVIDDTQASLMKLEKLTTDIYPGRITEYLNRSGRKAAAIAQMPKGQIAHFQKKTRFELAQAANCHVEYGNATAELMMLLKQLADDGCIDKKYKELVTYDITIPKSLVKHAKANQRYIDGQEWNEELLRTWLRMIENELAFFRNDIFALDDEIAEFGEEPHLLPPATFKEYMKVFCLREPFTILEENKKKLKMALASLQSLRKVFEKSDRLLVVAVNELHGFALRKTEDGKWYVIDSLESQQQHLQDPYDWLLKRQMSYFLGSGYSRYEFISLPDL